MDSQNNFAALFKFRPELSGYIGIEREQFLKGDSGIYVPESPRFLSLAMNEKWTYELSACQVESRTNPQTGLAVIKAELLANENVGNRVANQLGLELVNEEVAAEDMPLDVYPNPRYLKIAKVISRDRLRAACRVAGIHIHLGVRDLSHAIEVNNLLVPHLNALCDRGDHSGGERLRLYRDMAQNWQPVVYAGPEHLFEVARANGFADNPRNCWKLIRISIHGTVELRMFGSTNSVDEIIEWISVVKAITKGAL
ncbi:MAG: hypothetical protein UW46_C0004G0073 [Candidatus Yanofskybacteria bacterium GW2011_GWF1_44_227]|uniref:Uncharacterized protein n=1 Tax=Candidatus Yanofskybacteria bacterium GW2011_GWE2_40_11 TaxID=1619033 RepID=A0A0G0QKH5_9BACT|nr:MAG: hypothetical protein UT69_C0009G0005 [Candidatus Yanofskybacteria bacterium GW2011_GWE1_40_10]KKR40598.1 MAG: hypothetical protein UT75_C0007G0046 [Candidatus Yanofskybacteria bacterium GW2011_GWE2_40_11]KKT15604.1 MAG: hypothetical protein UV97_C0004G0020 [Candidatus Yanofskybacteria bacterium GW2011_GWF2_43_596]KKT53346.1 MAG: hypothetical protein UW46_C0004G0073 [Candidatus Yanofskybacteria bacterium GW2011_GWF1_44_227]OGN35974.1 MAG: hypothetical protein A2207_02855 [Candidatus Yano